MQFLVQLCSAHLNNAVLVDISSQRRSTLYNKRSQRLLDHLDGWVASGERRGVYPYLPMAQLSHSHLGGGIF